MNILDDKIKNYYNKYGVVVIRKVITDNWIQILSKGIEKNFKSPSKYKCVYEKDGSNNEIFYDDYCNWDRIDEYKEFFFQSNIAKIASELMLSKKVNLFHEHVLIKEPGSKKTTPWHQDQPYYCIDGKDNCSLWIPIDPVDKNVSPEFIRGSHKWNTKYLPTKFFGDSYEKKDDEFEKIPDIENNRQDYDIVSWAMKPGDLVAFNFSTIHSAPGNKSNFRRRAFSARFIGDDARFAKRKGEISPPFPELNFNHGDEINTTVFPEIPYYHIHNTVYLIFLLT